MLYRISRHTALAALSALIAMSVSTTASARLAFRGPSSYHSISGRPSSVAIGDLDRDGHGDLVVTSNSSSPARVSMISILKGNGDGTFEPGGQILAGYAPQAVVIEDLNGDEHLDLAVSHYGAEPSNAGNVSVILGHGDGSFQPAVDYRAGDRVRSLQAVDVDGDGDLDLVTENVVLLGTGDGTFGAATPFGGSGDFCASVGDLDRDGRPDVVSATFDSWCTEEDEPCQAFAVRLGNGDGTFQEPVRQGWGFACMDVEVADLNGDALPDVVVLNHGADRGEYSGVWVHLGRGDGTFHPGQLHATAPNPLAVSVADLNGDGRPDVVTANRGDDPDLGVSCLNILLGNGDGTFQRPSELPFGRAVVFAATGRLDADATLDLVAVDEYLSMVSVYLGNGDGTFGNADKLLGRRPLGLTAADFDQDGHIDLATTNGGPYTDPGGLSVIRGRGDGTFDDPLDSRSVGRSHLLAADLDGDPTPDLVVSTATGVSVMQANGDGTFRELVETFLNERVSGPPVIADLDGDGHSDLVVPQGDGAAAVSILLGHGDGAFGASSRAATGQTPYFAATGDLDGDGHVDIVTGLGGFSVSVLLGHGDGTFAPHVDYPGHSNANLSPIGLADLDEDGRLDVVSGSLVWLGNGDGTLRPGTLTDLGHDIAGMVLEDFDGDLHVDLAVFGDHDFPFVSIAPGRGDGTFGPRIHYGAGAYPRAMTAGDFDGDGRADLAVANNRSGSISILLNRSQAPVIPVRFELRPAVVNLRAEARWITGVVETTAPHSAGDIDVGSLRLNGVVPVDRTAPGPQGRGSRELILGFNRAALASILPVGGTAQVTITGKLGDGSLEGTTTVRVLGRGVPGSSTLAARYRLRLLVLPPARADARSLRLGITLAEEAPARLDVIDVAGRVVVSSSLESLAPGAHEIELTSTAALAPGIYFLRLRQGAQATHTRAAILR